jgi:4a-hydroxytetrahydrobiopterin dehydratase
MMTDLTRRRCKPCEGGVAPYDPKQVEELLRELRGWIVENGRLVKVYPFRNYYETMAFVNALAWIAHREDHHPDLAVHYAKCVVTFSTHDAGGVTQNDVICAAKTERLFT